MIIYTLNWRRQGKKKDGHSAMELSSRSSSYDSLLGEEEQSADGLVGYDASFTVTTNQVKSLGDATSTEEVRGSIPCWRIFCMAVSAVNFCFAVRRMSPANQEPIFRSTVTKDAQGAHGMLIFRRTKKQFHKKLYIYA